MEQSLEDYNSRCPHQLIDAKKEYVLAENLPEGIHTVTVLRRNEVCLNKEIVMTDIRTDGRFSLLKRNRPAALRSSEIPTLRATATWP